MKKHGGGKAALLGCLFAVAAYGQPQPPAGLTPLQPLLPSDGVVVVQVSDSQGRPLSGALVVLRGHTASERPQQITRHGASDASGRLRFADLPNGAYSADARMAGCLLAPTSAQNTQLQGAKPQGQIQLVLRRRPVLTGRVVDERGTPLLGAQVQAFRLASNDGEQYLNQVQGASTDDRGVYRLSVHEPGRYWVMAFHMEPSFPRGSAPRSTGVVFYPNSPDLLASLPAELSFDQPETTLDIALPPAARTEIVAGILTGPDSRPCTRCRYSLRRVEGAFSYDLTSGQTGRDAGFDTRGVPAGQYRIYVQDDGSDQGWWALAEATLVEDRTTALTIQTQPPVAASGRITLEDPPREAIEQARERSDAVILQLNQSGNHFFAVRDGSSQHAELPLDQSEFTLGALPAEKFRVEVFVQGANAYLAGIARQGRDLNSPILDFSQPGPWTNLEVRVRFDLAEPNFVLGGEGVNSASSPDGPAYRLVLAPDPEQNPFGRYFESQCVPDGHCYAPPTPPGRYWVIVFRATNQGGPDLQDPEVRKKLAPWGREITLAPGQNPKLNLTLAPEKAFAAL